MVVLVVLLVLLAATVGCDAGTTQPTGGESTIDDVITFNAPFFWVYSRSHQNLCEDWRRRHIVVGHRSISSTIFLISPTTKVAVFVRALSKLRWSYSLDYTTTIVMVVETVRVFHCNSWRVASLGFLFYFVTALLELQWSCLDEVVDFLNCGSGSCYIVFFLLLFSWTTHQRQPK